MKAEISTMQEKIDREGAKAPEKQQNEGGSIPYFV